MRICSLYHDSIYLEKHTITKMIGIYCNRFHETSMLVQNPKIDEYSNASSIQPLKNKLYTDETKSSLCKECEALKDYAFNRLDNCRYGNKKPACQKCKTHCYNKTQKEEIKNIMKYSGPRMIFRYPILAIIHLLK